MVAQCGWFSRVNVEKKAAQKGSHTRENPPLAVRVSPIEMQPSCCILPF
jgi:hypothetical protein